MKALITLALLIVLGNSSMGQSPNFSNSPWQNGFPVVLDAYYLNAINYTQLKASKKVSAIIFKASGGMKADTLYTKSAKKARDNGFLVASYHLGLNSDPIKQADFYLARIGADTTQPMALDIEGLENNNISLPDAEKFIKRIFEKTGKYPFLYCNNVVFESINTKYDRKSVFANCPLWYARFNNKPLPILSNKVWDKVTLWQFACEINCQDKTTKGDKAGCPIRIAGTANDMDVNAFNGTLEDMKAFWKK
jgi:lysozyme